MRYYYEPSYTKESSSSTGRKLAAVIIIFMILLTGGVISILQLLPNSIIPPGTQEGVRVAVIDSGLDVDFSSGSRVVAQQSFILVEYGYDATDLTTTDSNPDDGQGNRVRHGTIVTQVILQTSQAAVIVNAKVIDQQGYATGSALVAAIMWAVEQNCSVINLSVGSSPTFGDPLEAAVNYAFSKGVVVVSAAGNEGFEGIAGTSISSPSVYSNGVSVGALEDDDTPSSYSSWGPAREKYVKPDISAEGSVQTSNAIYFGTSFAAPKVAGVVADLIGYCIQNDLTYTAGSIIAALLSGAEPLSYPSYVVGAGKVNLAASKLRIDQAPKRDTLPLLTYLGPKQLPLDFETLFQGDNYSFNVQIFTSDFETFEITDQSLDDLLLPYPTSVAVNQSGQIPIEINVPDGIAGNMEGLLFFDAGETNVTLAIEFMVSAPVARIAFDITHTPWNIDSMYGQFKELYIELTENDIAVTEIRDRALITSSYLSNFDAVFILDPCSRYENETNPLNPEVFFIPFTQNETMAYQDYFEGGGGLFIAALDNSSIDIASLNEFLNFTGISLNFDRIPNGNTPIEISDLETHPITTGVSSFNHLGASLDITGSNATLLASFFGYAVLACLENNSTGRLIVAGTNFFIDNWGMRGLYSSNSNRILALKIALWLTDLLG
ncbi:MAG: S8 family serine peptidase [Candidatus Thorarchaeota archaeon]